MKILIADDQRLLREGLATIIGLEDDMEVAATAVDGKDAYEKALEYRPDVVVMDIRMPVMDGVDGAELILKHLPSTKVLILTTFDDGELILRAMDRGVHGYLLKDMPSEAIISAIHTVYNGGTVLQTEITAALLKELRNTSARSPLPGSCMINHTELELVQLLTDREREILGLLGQGLNNREIAGILHITEGTAKNHVSNLIAKLGLRDRTQAAVMAVRHQFHMDQS